MSIILIFLFFFNLSFPLLGLGKDDCMPIRCRKNGPIIQFPFRHKYLHPQYCGYPGFEVYCDEKNKTVLELPSSVNLVVQKIDYASQKLHVYDSENCPQQMLRYLNLSASPFSFGYLDLVDIDLFKCSVSNINPDSSLSSCPCLRDSNYEFYAISTDSESYYLMTNCSKTRRISSVSWDIFRKNGFHLNWWEPACGSCEAQGKRCSFKNYTRAAYQNQIHCIDKPEAKQDKRTLIAGATVGSFFFLASLVALFVIYGSIKRGRENQKKIEKFLEDYRALKPTRFSYADIRRFTNQFSEKLGEGGYGIVYRGKLSNEINVAVKVLNNSEGNGDEFINEVGTIGRIHHVNVVRLVGFCAEGFRRALVYEFLPNDSLEKFIFSRKGSDRSSLGWKKLLDIALGIAKGIEYLHQGCDQQILHFDIKPHNILLDHNFNPKICDFGLAKLCSKEKSAVTMSAARGTMGYIAPEVLSRTFGQVSYKSDVYSFGMLLLEMVGGRKNVDLKVNNSQTYFPQWIYTHLNLTEDFWTHVEEVEDGCIARKVAMVGLWCIQWHPTDRPSMKGVVQMLEGDGDDLAMPPNPFPPANVTNSIAGLAAGSRYPTELPIILELEE